MATRGRKSKHYGIEENDRKLQFGMWLALPLEARKQMGIDSQKELAEKLDLTPKTLSEWQNDTTVIWAKQNAMKLFLGVGIQWEVINMLKKKALDDGNVTAAKVLLEASGIIGAKPQTKEFKIQAPIKIEVVKPSEVKPEDKDAIDQS